MGDARIRLSPVRVVEVIHEFPVVDWRYHGLNTIFFKYGISFLYISVALEVRFELEISSLNIETWDCPDIEETSVPSYVEFIIYVCFVKVCMYLTIGLRTPNQARFGLRST